MYIYFFISHTISSFVPGFLFLRFPASHISRLALFISLLQFSIIYIFMFRELEDKAGKYDPEPFHSSAWATASITTAESLWIVILAGRRRVPSEDTRVLVCLPNLFFEKKNFSWKVLSYESTQITFHFFPRWTKKKHERHLPTQMLILSCIKANSFIYTKEPE